MRGRRVCRGPPTPFAPNSHANVSRLAKLILRKNRLGFWSLEKLRLTMFSSICRNSDLLDMFMKRQLPQVVTGIDDPKDKKCSCLHFFLHSAVPIYDISYHKSDECLSHSHNKYLKSLISTCLKVASCAPGLMETEQVTGNSHFGVYCHPLTMHGSFLFMPCGTTFLRVLIFAVFPAIRKNRFRQIKITTNIFSAKIYSNVDIL